MVVEGQQQQDCRGSPSRATRAERGDGVDRGMGTAANLRGGLAGWLLAMFRIEPGAGPNGGLRPTASGLTIVEADAVPGEIRGFSRSLAAQLNSRR